MIAIDAEEILKGYGFMERLKKRWDKEFPEKTHYSAKGLRNNSIKKEKEAEIHKIQRK